MSEQATPHYYNAVVVDTLTQVMTDTYVEHEKEVGLSAREDWRNYGIELMYLYQFIRGLEGAVIVQVLGQEGTGKSAGARTLDPNTTMYLNQDKKPLTFDPDGEMYPNDAPQGKSNSKANYKECIPAKNSAGKVEVWTPIRNAIQYAYDRKKPDEKFVVFVIGHVDVYEGTDGLKRERLRVLGKAANKLNIEGSIVYTFYSKVDPTAASRVDRYKLTMHNSGFNTARVPMGKFDDVEEIPNNLQLIIDRINNKQKINN